MNETALKTLKGRSRVRRTMWSRRAQEYEAKINSGDPVSIAEVVRDLHETLVSRSNPTANGKSIKPHLNDFHANWQRLSY